MAPTVGRMPPVVLAPFVMWAGGKSKMIRHYRPLWPSGPACYVEPFFGAGAVFGWLAGEQRFSCAHIGDVNAELTGLLVELRDRPDSLIDGAEDLARRYLAVADRDGRRRFYYALRASYWAEPDAARLLVLLRLGFNGIWQTCRASHGLYATPAGLLHHTVLPQVVDAALLRRWSAALSGVAVHTGSFTTFPMPDEPSCVFLDPPYRHSHTTYGTRFDDTDQQALAEWFRRQVYAGHRVLLANRSVAGDRFFEDRLGDIADFSYFDVTYTAGRRRRAGAGFAASPAVELLAISRL